MKKYIREIYVFLVLLMVYESRLFEDILNNIINDKDEINLNEKKCKFLEVCKSLNMVNFEIIDVLFEMEGIYIKKCGIDFMFVYDFLFEIVVYYFGF